MSGEKAIARYTETGHRSEGGTSLQRTTMHIAARPNARRTSDRSNTGNRFLSVEIFADKIGAPGVIVKINGMNQ